MTRRPLLPLIRRWLIESTAVLTGPFAARSHSRLSTDRGPSRLTPSSTWRYSPERVQQTSWRFIETTRHLIAVRRDNGRLHGTSVTDLIKINKMDLRIACTMKKVLVATSGGLCCHDYVVQPEISFWISLIFSLFHTKLKRLSSLFASWRQMLMNHFRITFPFPP